MNNQISLQEANDLIERSIDEVLTLIAEDRKRDKLIPLLDINKYKTEFRSKINSEVAHCVNEFNQRFHQGVSAIWESLGRSQHGKIAIDKAVEELQKILTALEKERENNTFLEERIQKSETLKMFMGFSDKTIEEFYRAAYTIHEAKQFESAANSFYFLCALDPWVHSFWMGYGNSEQMLGHHLPALYAYAMAALIDAGDPTPHYFAAQCYEKLNDIPEAVHSLDLAIECPSEENHAKLVKAAALKLKTDLSRQLKY